MPKFRTKPKEIEAEQFFRPVTSLIITQTGVCQCEKGSKRGHLHTMHGGQTVDLENGDWIVPEHDGEHFYPIKDEIFKEKYELIDDEKTEQTRDRTRN